VSRLPGHPPTGLHSDVMLRCAMHQRTMGLGQTSSSFGEGGIEKRLRALSQLTEISGRRVLDIGCANGADTVRLAEHFDRVDAIDIEPERLADFRRAVAGSHLASKITIAEMAAESLDFAAETFDAVTTIEVLEHVRDLDRSIAEVHRVLKPGGRFLITSPNRLFPFETHGFLIGGRRYPPARGPFLPWVVPLHTRLADARTFTAGGLTRKIERVGFRRLGKTYIMPPFDRSRVGRQVRPLTDRIERSPLRIFGMALVLVFTKLPTVPPDPRLSH
jgi:SAM-dependent methyltransferase